jgi:hypothetical protein
MAQRGLSSEMSSIILALGLSGFAFLFFKYAPNYEPQMHWVRGLPGWLALGYVTVQLWMLLDSALRIRPTSVIDAVLAIAPVVTGIVCGVLWMVGHLHLSLFQLNALAMLIVTGVVEFVSTLWVRNVVLQRGVSVVPHPEQV